MHRRVRVIIEKKLKTFQLPVISFFSVIDCHFPVVRFCKSLVWLPTELDSTQSYYHFNIRISSIIHSRCEMCYKFGWDHRQGYWKCNEHSKRTLVVELPSFWFKVVTVLFCFLVEFMPLFSRYFCSKFELLTLLVFLVNQLTIIRVYYTFILVRSLLRELELEDRRS